MREPNSRVEFEKDDFIFSDQVEGSAKEVIVLGIDWNRIGHKHEGAIGSSKSSIPIIGNIINSNKANSYALYNMMANHPGYDVVFYPQFHAHVSKPFLGIGFIYRKTETDVKARLGKINPTEGHTDSDD